MESNQSSNKNNPKANETKEMSYNEALQWMAKYTGGKGTSSFSNTDTEAVKRYINSNQNQYK